MRLLIFLACLLFASSAMAWDIKDLNKTVDQTNFILDDQCSATLISLKYKLVLTNYHCVDSKVKYRTKEVIQDDGTIKKVKVPDYRDVILKQKAYRDYQPVGTTTYYARIVAHAQEKDLALLQIRADEIPYTRESRILPNDKKLFRGETAYAVGNPLGLDASVTKGIISSVNRMFRVRWAKNQPVPFIQFSGGLAGGNSGGALYNSEGYFIGVPAAGVRHSHLGLAIPYTVVREFLTEACYRDVWDQKAKPGCKKK